MFMLSEENKGYMAIVNATVVLLKFEQQSTAAHAKPLEIKICKTFFFAKKAKLEDGRKKVR